MVQGPFCNETEEFQGVLRKGALNMEVTPDPPALPWIAAGDHRGSRAPSSAAASFEYSNLTGGARLSAS